MSADLKPCPFCGGSKITFLYDIETMAPNGMRCSSCKAIVRWPIRPMQAQETFGDYEALWAARWCRRAGEVDGRGGES